MLYFSNFILMQVVNEKSEITKVVTIIIMKGPISETGLEVDVMVVDSE